MCIRAGFAFRRKETLSFYFSFFLLPEELGRNYIIDTLKHKNNCLIQSQLGGKKGFYDYSKTIDEGSGVWRGSMDCLTLDRWYICEGEAPPSNPFTVPLDWNYILGFENIFNYFVKLSFQCRVLVFLTLFLLLLIHFIF